MNPSAPKARVAVIELLNTTLHAQAMEWLAVITRRTPPKNDEEDVCMSISKYMRADMTAAAAESRER